MNPCKNCPISAEYYISKFIFAVANFLIKNLRSIMWLIRKYNNWILFIYFFIINILEKYFAINDKVSIFLL